MDTSIFTLPHVIWFFLGLVLLLGELALPGFVTIFFGAGAWITALTVWIFDIELTAQLSIFIISSTVLLLLLRRTLKNKFFNEKKEERGELDEDFIGKQVIAEVDFEPGHIGKVQFNGAPWKATCATPVKKDQVLVVIDFNNITLIVKPLN